LERDTQGSTTTWRHSVSARGRVVAQVNRVNTTNTVQLRVPAHDGHDSEPVADAVPTAWRTVFRWHGGRFGGRIGTLSAMIS
jgi:hypothetical protein